MYLFIFEDGEVKKASAVGDDDLQSCDDGYLDIIDIVDPDCPMRRYGDGWAQVESLD